MSVQEHKKQAPNSVACKIITVSDTRDKETDKSGKLIMELLEAQGHTIADYCIVKDEGELIKTEVQNGCANPEVEVVITNGGTGIAMRDVTIETVTKLFEKEISGFGELFRMLSYQEDIGSAALMSRAAAGVVNHRAVFSIPGSSGAVRLAMNKLILPEIGHVVRELKKDLL
ncbi:MogA/MoaB family molybdenum cofactor biosynthesis protein [Neobacillus notoginsengisoli]|uniref:Molybdenum cofactor biosynthesis protein B n=1 Tax=Neobacillus notoginsengisoli TaxID=1578198 RepID=A0A417YUF2_9BACI|nr:MogA/MoaB family molybdenum cofactor biosynthesis protein [Neobacillus notoginsengisoli]RHW40745.1 MogA/MoaB family molybdenum cofactor biosynthesis protein [Neobacillus notoginsengisoli]